jgi:hypothetical protein
MTLTTPSVREPSELVAQCANAANLCGIVTKNAVDVAGSGEARHDGVEFVLCHLHRNAYGVLSASLESTGQTQGRLRILDRVSDNWNSRVVPFS